jgi:hypothetical protein
VFNQISAILAALVDYLKRFNKAPVMLLSLSNLRKVIVLKCSFKRIVVGLEQRLTIFEILNISLQHWKVHRLQNSIHLLEGVLFD